MLDDPGLGPALRNANVHLALGLGRQRLCEKLAVGHVVGDEDQLRHRLVVVELRDEAVEHLLHGQRAIGLGEVGAVAPVLAGAKEEHLDARLPAVLRGGEDVGLLNPLRIDRLVGGDVREGGEAIAEACRPLELELRGGLLHQALVQAPHVLALAAQEAHGLVDEAAVVLERDLSRAGRRAALDLVQQAGARAAFVDAVGARAEKERALQHVDRAVDGAG